MKEDSKHKDEHKSSKKLAKELDKLEEKLQQLEKERDELFSKLQRVSADYANFQKRSAKQVSEAITYEKESIIKTLLPALDNFDHTVQNADSTENIEVIRKGIHIIYGQIMDILKSHNVEQIQAAGEQFDPSVHEAMMRRHEEDKDDNVVLEEFQKGYKLNGRVIRPSKVIVNKAEEKPREDEESTEQQ